MNLDNFVKYTLILFLILPVFAFTAYYGISIIDGGNSWKTGDWLINYESGFIRRGLSGHIFINLSVVTGVNLLYISFFFQSITYFLIVFLVFSLYFKEKRDLFWIVFLVSPAFIFFFPFYNLAGGFRKEILGFLAFLILLHGLLLNSNLIKFISLLVYTFSVYSHELNALLLPFFIYVLIFNTLGGFEFSRNKNSIESLINQLKVSGNLVYVIAFLAVALPAFFLSVIFSGETQQGELICNSLIQNGLSQDICSGAIAWIGRDASYGFERVVSYISSGGYLFYIVYFMLSLMPFLLFKWFYRKNILGLVSVSLLALMPLFAVAIDWGRWIHIFIFMLTVLFLYESCNVRAYKDTLIKIPFFAKVALIVFYVTWAIPHCCSVDLKYGIFETLLKILYKVLQVFNLV